MSNVQQYNSTTVQQYNSTTVQQLEHVCAMSRTSNNVLTNWN